MDPLTRPHPLGPTVVQEAIHSTTVTRLQGIQANGFQVGMVANRRGPGVYFWQKNPYWEKIGRSWHKSASKFGSYIGDANLHCGIVHAYIEAAPERYIDMEGDEFKRALFEIAYAKGLTKRMEQEGISDLWTMFIENIEKRTGTSIAFFRVALELPDGGDWYPFKALGNPIAFVVRDLNTITITNYNTYEETFNG